VRLKCVHCAAVVTNDGNVVIGTIASRRVDVSAENAILENTGLEFGGPRDSIQLWMIMKSEKLEIHVR